MTFRFVINTLLALAVAFVMMLIGVNAQTAPRAVPAQVLAVAGRTNASVSLAVNGPLVVAVWAASLPAGATDIYAAVSRDSGATFTAPVRVNSKPGDARVNGEQPPRVAIRNRVNASPEIVAVWTSKADAGGTIVSARSVDGGKTFGTTALVAESPGNRGWENIAVDAAGGVHVVWLDHRELAQSGSMNHAEEHHTAPAESKKEAVDMAQHSKLYTAILGDPASGRAITGGVCYCCKTAIVAAPDNGLYLAWRHVYPQNVRDMAFTTSHDGGRTFSAPVRISEDQWQIEGCPEDGPALALDGRRQVHVVWPTLVNDGPDGRPSIGIFYGRSTTGQSFGVRQRVPTEGVPHHPQIAVVRDVIYLAWDELKNGARQVVLARRPLTASANAAWPRQVLSDNLPGIYPSLASGDAGVMVAWTSAAPNSVIRAARIN